MKKTFTILIFMLFSLGGHAQSYLPFPDSGATWVNTFAYLVTQPFLHCGDPYATNYCVYGEDTTINTNTYTIVRICEQNTYSGAWRDSSGVVYYVPVDSTTEYLLYDFTVQVGDTIPEVWMGEVVNDLQVYQVDSTLIWGEYRKVIHIGDYPWIEGIGCTQGLFMNPWVNISDVCFELQCMSEHDTTLFPNEDIGSCYLGVGLEENLSPTVKIYPNPSTTGNVFVEANQEAGQLTYNIFNSLGQIIASGILEEEQLFISDKSGVYYLQISSVSGIITRRIIVE
ncbi:MAG: T9SS type A sorting domain-containing protein [Crocinitomicaceae bacterium]